MCSRSESADGGNCPYARVFSSGLCPLLFSVSFSSDGPSFVERGCFGSCDGDCGVGGRAQAWVLRFLSKTTPRWSRYWILSTRWSTRMARVAISMRWAGPVSGVTSRVTSRLTRWMTSGMARRITPWMASWVTARMASRQRRWW
jgi:hypothetical protein